MGRFKQFILENNSEIKDSYKSLGAMQRHVKTVPGHRVYHQRNVASHRREGTGTGTITSGHGPAGSGPRGVSISHNWKTNYEGIKVMGQFKQFLEANQYYDNSSYDPLVGRGGGSKKKTPESEHLYGRMTGYHNTKFKKSAKNPFKPGTDRYRGYEEGAKAAQQEKK